MFSRKKKKRRTLTRYIYLMERITKRRWSTIFSLKREIKLGIAKDVEDRHKTVDRGIKGKVIILEKYKVPAASTIEAELHRKYKEENFTIEDAKKNAGGTEFFQLTNNQIGNIKRFLSKKAGHKYYNLDRIIQFVFWVCLILLIISQNI